MNATTNISLQSETLVLHRLLIAKFCQVYVWIHIENGWITVSHHDFARSYTLQLQQNHVSSWFFQNHRWSEHTLNNHFLLYYYFLDAICQTHPVVRSPFSLPFILTKWVCLQMILLKFWKKLDLYGFLVEKMLMFVLWIEDLEIGIMCTGFRSGWK